MKVVLVYKYFLPNIGGIEKIMSLVAESLNKLGLNVTILSTNLIQGIPSLPQIDKANGLKIYRIHSLSSILKHVDLTINLSDIVSILKKADIVHIFSSIPSSLLYFSILFSKIIKKPILWQPIYHPTRFKTYDSRLLRFLVYLHDFSLFSILSMLPCGIVCLTDDEAIFFRNFGVKNVCVLGECVEEVDIPKDKVYGVLKKSRLGYGCYVLSVGRIAWYKGYDLLIKAWSCVEKKFPNTKLVIVGSNWGFKETLEKMISELNIRNVVFTGPIDDFSLHALYKGCSFVTSLSHFETFHRIALEAWSHRKPIVALNLRGPTRHISPDTGILVNDDAAEVCEALMRLLSDEVERKTMGKKGYKKFYRFYSVESYTNRLLSLYNKILKAK